MECSPGITREEALDLLRRNVKNESMIKHCHASEAVMVALAKRLGEDEKTWGLAGLLHDIDIEITGADLSEHGLKAVEILDAAGVSKEISLAIKMHNESAHGIPRSERFHHALAAGESITGLITATTLVYPDKKLASVKPSSVVKRMKEKSFAASVDREIIRECEKIDVPLPEFAALAIEAMREIAPELGL
ncbi:MAG TPA: hydrolase [Cyanobacteria bacterium UBA8530]|nr:hydrolase [Cyanobacteria bacterium UBA8530]